MKAIDYFKGLHGLRGIAAILVLVGHSKTTVFPGGWDGNPIASFFTDNDNNAVSFFFVLSGFLISYLLLKEREDTSSIKVGRFYVKRMLRIWPIYFLIILLVQFIFPVIMQMIGMEWKTVSNTSLFFYLLILPNIPYLFFDCGKLFHLWSIGVEEQFYLVWAPLVKLVKNNFVRLCVLIILVKLLVLLVLGALEQGNIVVHNILAFMRQFKIEQMCIGGLGAYFVFVAPGRLETYKLFNKFFQILLFALLFFFLAFSTEKNAIVASLYDLLFNKLGYILVPALYLYLILNVSLNDGSMIRLENRIFRFFGTISYGFYVYHFISLLITEYILRRMHITNQDGQFPYLFYSMAIIINTVIASLSFYYFESWLINIGRRKFKKIDSKAA